jgi:hypothetical protein
VGTVWRVARVVAGTVAVLFGAGLYLLAVTLGDCSAFGGRCPQDVPPLLDDDVFWMAAFGAAIAVGVPTLLAQPSRRRAAIAAGVALGAGLLAGLIARGSAYQ